MSDHRPAPQDASVRTKPARRPAPRLGRSITPHLRRLAQQSGAMDPRLVEHWAEIAGADLAKLCRPIRIIKRGKIQALEVSVESGAAAMRVQYAQTTLLSRIRDQLGLPHLTKITFREGKAPRGWEQRRMQRPAEGPAEKRENKAPAGSLAEALTRMRQTIHQSES
ncbi:MAG: DUF721 domain-containing protein [Pseudomonadota bacterium]